MSTVFDDGLSSDLHSFHQSRVAGGHDRAEGIVELSHRSGLAVDEDPITLLR